MSHTVPDHSIPFVPGLTLSGALYAAVEPLLARHFPDLRYGAGRLEAGSDVLGFDTPRSMDHDWGPQLSIYLPEAVWSPGLAAGIRQILAEQLPFEILGVPTHFHDRLVTATDTRPIAHGVAIVTARGVFAGWLGLDRGAETPPNLEDWLVIPEQQLRAFTSGAVFRDDTGELARARAMLAWYPRDVWLYLLAAQWLRIDQEEPFMGRCGEVGDDLGSRLVAARLVREFIHLCFLMERQYAPYTKWFGSAFARLDCAPRLSPSLTGALAADSWQERERHLNAAPGAACLAVPRPALPGHPCRPLLARPARRGSRSGAPPPDGRPACHHRLDLAVGRLDRRPCPSLGRRAARTLQHRRGITLSWASQTACIMSAMKRPDRSRLATPVETANDALLSGTPGRPECAARWCIAS